MKFVYKTGMALVFAAGLLAPQIQAMDPVTSEFTQSVANPVWQAVQENAKQTLDNIWSASCNVMSFVPYVLRQVTHEARVLTHGLQDAPLTTTALMAAAVYGAWKAYSWFKKPDVQQYIQERWVRVRDMRQGGNHNPANVQHQ